MGDNCGNRDKPGRLLQLPGMSGCSVSTLQGLSVAMKSGHGQAAW